MTPQVQQTAPKSTLELILERLANPQQQQAPVDLMGLLKQSMVPRQTTPWADTMSPERQKMYYGGGNLMGPALGSPGNPYSWDHSGDVQRWAAGPTPIQNQQWLNRQAPQVYSPTLPSIDMWTPNAQVQNRVMPNPTTPQLQQMNPPNMVPYGEFGPPPPYGAGWPSMAFPGTQSRPNYWGI